MASYYYLIASLPMLRFDAPPPCSVREFRETCRQSLAQGDWELVEAVMSENDSPSGHPYIRRWNTFRAQLRGMLREQRVQRLGLAHDEQHQRIDRDVQVAEAVRAAMQAEHPLEAELILMRLQWDHASRLAQAKVFEVEVLLTYAIQLGILERKALFVPAEGNAEFKRLFSNLQSIIKSI